MDGGANEIRTHDLCSAIAALSQLSYGPFISHLGEAPKSCQGKPLAPQGHELGLTSL